MEQNGVTSGEENGAHPTETAVQRSNGYGTSVAVPKASRVVNLRSDTFTEPTPAMRAAMASALVGDDVYLSDPTANEFQESAAKLFGKEAALFVPSGTMGNLISVLVHCEKRGSEVILGSESHIRCYEQGGISSLGGVYPNVVLNQPDGTMDLSQVESAIQLEDLHVAVTRLICLENSHNRCGGRCLTAEYTDEVGELAKKYDLKLHIDGARIFNAATALGVSVERLVRAADSVSVCLSKGLAAPVGSILVGSHTFIEKARRVRKVLGGAMRQIGVLCAAGRIALHEMSKRLEEDHRNAYALAKGLNALPGLRVDLDAVETNIVYVAVTKESPVGSDELCERLNEKGVMVLSLDAGSIRMLTHYHISASDVQFAISCFENILKPPSV